MAKMENIQTAAEYLRKRSTWPVLKGHKLRLRPDTRMKHKRKTPSDTLKMYDDTATEELCKSNESSDCTEDNESD